MMMETLAMADIGKRVLVHGELWKSKTPSQSVDVLVPLTSHSSDEDASVFRESRVGQVAPGQTMCETRWKIKLVDTPWQGVIVGKRWVRDVDLRTRAEGHGRPTLRYGSHMELVIIRQIEVALVIKRVTDKPVIVPLHMLEDLCQNE